MKRTRFIAAISTLLSAPSLAFSSLRKALPPGKGFKVNVSEGRKHGHLKLKGVNVNIIDVKISGSDTDGGLAVFEQTSLSPGRGTPLHVHPAQDEVFYVLEGMYYFQVGDEKYTLKTGDSIFLPRQVPHAWTQVAERGKMIVMLQPAGKLEDFFVSLAGMDRDPSKEELARLFADNQMQVVGPPLKID
ncbi:Cupin 2 conserved barrel domain protein [Fibrisoma limi BUZ 3]|uniref:Cupin 2 conserved barrel domain protein n=1 Tax=Fibrisoma limi BUZ 3 TaxID=1185876 RepID=I2GIV4_9BACT|nr:cupin domain-containing protein [Fibrisoma limi]CCH53829.1 Cupin 2 conserved barrel domain protein [Fibrisoma limi BUZ 3]